MSLLPPETDCWVLTEGHVGMENQALGVAEALGLSPKVKRLWPRLPWRAMPPRLWRWPLLPALAAPGRAKNGQPGDKLGPPWPDLLITCGKRATAPSVAIRRASRGRTFTVHIQQPPLPRRAFDLLAIPAHDSLRGDNVVVTDAAVHRVTPAKLREAAARFQPALDGMPKPWIAVLIGGSNNRYRLTTDIARRLAGQLTALGEETGGSLLVTASRRTGAENEAILRSALAETPGQFWNGAGENPYFGWLGLADYIVVTCDSVSMTSEACSTGKPVYVIDLDGHSRRIDSFHRHLREKGFTRPFSGSVQPWSYTPLDDTTRVAEAIRLRMEEERLVRLRRA